MRRTLVSRREVSVGDVNEGTRARPAVLGGRALLVYVLSPVKIARTR